MSASCARRSRIPLRILGGLVANGATAQDAPVAGKATLGMTVTETRLVATCCRASKMIHADVYHEKNETIGRVDGLFVTPDGSRSTAIIDVGGFLLMKARRVAFAHSASQADSAEGNRGRRKQGCPEKAAVVRIWRGLTSAANIGRSH
jgi:hypothetical protein